MSHGPQISRSAPAIDRGKLRAIRRLPGVQIAIAAATLLALFDVLAGPTVVVAGLVAVGPCLAATSGGRAPSPLSAAMSPD